MDLTQHCWYFQHIATYKEVRLAEVIGNIPAYLAVFSSLLHHCMEEGQDVHQATESSMWTRSQSLMGNF